jgi:hypothetical protein
MEHYCTHLCHSDACCQDSGMQVQESGTSCIYAALAGPKSAVGHFPQSRECVSTGAAGARVQRVHEPADLWDITFCTL